jgi:hypothetical protein
MGLDVSLNLGLGITVVLFVTVTGSISVRIGVKISLEGALLVLLLLPLLALELTLVLELVLELKALIVAILSPSNGRQLVLSLLQFPLFLQDLFFGLNFLGNLRDPFRTQDNALFLLMLNGLLRRPDQVIGGLFHGVTRRLQTTHGLGLGVGLNFAGHQQLSGRRGHELG